MLVICTLIRQLWHTAARHRQYAVRHIRYQHVPALEVLRLAERVSACFKQNLRVYFSFSGREDFTLRSKLHEAALEILTCFLSGATSHMGSFSKGTPGIVSSLGLACIILFEYYETEIGRSLE